MSIRRGLLQVLSIIVILTMLFSGFSLPAASAQEKSDGLKRQVNHQTGRVSFIGPESGRSLSASKALGTFIRPENPAFALAERFGSEFGLKNPGRDLKEMKSHHVEDGRITARFQQNYQGIPVMGGELIVNTNGNADLYSINGEVSGELSLSIQPTIDSEQARQTALQAAAKWYEKTPEDFAASTPELWIYDESLLRPSTRPAELVWRMEITPKDVGMPVRELVLVNAQRGHISLHFNQVDMAWSRRDLAQDTQPTPMPQPTATASPIESSEPQLTATQAHEQTELHEEVFTPGGEKGEIATFTGTTWYVATAGNDSNSCLAAGAPCATIKGALAKASAGDLVRVGSGTYTGTSTNSNVVIISKSITLSGGWDNTFTLQNGVSTVDGSGLRNGILANATGSLVTVESFVVQNSYTGSDSGGISIYGANFTLKNSSVINNTARGRGAGIFINSGTLMVLNSTISGNKATSSGGGIHVVNGTVTINNSTIAYNNSKGTGGGITVGGGTFSVKNSLLARNTATGGGPDCSGSVAASDHNIYGSTSGCSMTSGPGDQLNIDPLIDASLSGGVPLHALQVGSPAINAGDNGTCLVIDQRNMPRPQGSACDIGAYESAEEGRLLAVSGFDQTTTFGSPFPLVLTIHLFDSSANPLSGITVTFTAPASGASGMFADTGTNVTTATTDDNGQASTSIFTANTSRGSYSVSATADSYSDLANFLLTNVNALFVATTGSDSNSCMEPSMPCLTINGAINKAVSGDKIVVASGTYSGSGTEVVKITKSITLSGGWDNAFTAQTGTSVIDGGGARRGITATDVQVSIDRLTIQNGYHTSQGGGIYNYGGTLTLNNSLVTQNVSKSMGGGIYNYGTLKVNNTGISNNSAGTATSSGGGGGAGILSYSGNAVLNNSAVNDNVILGDFDATGIVNYGASFVLNNSTVSSNTGDDAIYNSTGSLTLSNSTVSSNAKLGIRNASGTVSIQNTILANNSIAVSGQDCAGTITSLGHNLIGKTFGCTFTSVAGDQTNVNPMLNPSLVGAPAYHALLSNSPAIDAGDPATCLATDQRGVTRPQGSACDIGAYEYTAPSAAASLGIAGGNDQRTGVSFPFPLPLSVYVLDDSGNPVSGVEVTFTAPASGPSGTFADTGTNMTTVSVNSNGMAVSSVFTANSQRGTYEVVTTVSGLSDSVSFHLTNSTLFVSPDGNDGNSCNSPADPCLTPSAAVNKAGSIDVIKVAAGSYAGVDVQKSLTISGGWDNTFSAQTGYSTITGYSGIYASAADIFLSRFIVQNSHYGIFHGTGVLSFDQGALINNDTGLYNATGDTTLTNVTISGNHASTGSGSAIMNMTGNIRVQYSTITNNTGDYAVRSQTTDNANIEIGNSILAGNGGGDCYIPYKNMTSAGHNIFGSVPACSSSPYFVPDPTDQLGTDPQLSPLLPVGYHPLSPNSPAVGHADPASCPATDQRGIARPQGQGCDIGAYEYTAAGAAARLGSVSGSNQHSGPSLPFVFPLVVYVTDLSGNPVSGVTVTFTAPASGPSGTFANTATNTTTAVTDAGGLATSPVFSANSQVGSYVVTAAAPGLSGSASFALTNAALFVSPTGNDGSSCSLPTSPCKTINGAISKSVSGDAISVATGTYSSINISKSLTITGGWDNSFSTQTGYSIVTSNSDLYDGIYANASNISISRFVVQNSKTGIFHSSGTLSFDQGALINNNMGFYIASGEATLTNATISGNQAGFREDGSAIKNLGGLVRIRYSTITNNTSDHAVYLGSSQAQIEMGNNILAGNSGEDCYISSGSMTSTGHNLFGNSPACSGSQNLVPDPTDQLGIDPKLSILLPGNYHALLPGSAAIDNADPASCPVTDQRGITRPQDIQCDSGAYEYTTPGIVASLGIVSGSDQHAGPSLPFSLPLTVYVLDTWGSPVGGVTVTFTAPASGPGGKFADTGTRTTTIVTNAGGLATSTIFTANSQQGSYAVTANVSGLSGSVSFALTNAGWFVSSTGSDANSCNSPASPCKTINGAVNKSANGDGIKVAIGIYGPAVINKTLTMTGGWDSTFSSQTGYSTVDGNVTSQGISVGGSTVTMSRFVVQNSNFGIYHSGGKLFFDRGASINNNNGLYNYSGDMVFTNATISGNHAGDTNGNVYGGSAISNVSGLVRIQHSTITNNGGTEAIWSTNSSAHVEIGNSILAGNPRGDCYAQAVNMTSLGHNIFGSSPSCQPAIAPFVPDPTDQVGVNPQLGALFLFGYHPLMADSPAIDAANPLDCPAVDQRDVTRPVGASCDIGAIEYHAGMTPQYIFAYEGSPQILMINNGASSRLIAIVFDEDGDRVQGKTVTFTAPDHGASAIFEETGTSTSTVVTDVNGFATSPAFSANGIGGSYFIVATVNGVDTAARFSLSNSTIAVNPRIQTYTANNFTNLPGTLLCTQSKPGCTNGFDAHADAAHKYALGTYSLYASAHSRNSINNAGMTIVSSVHYASAYANAAWNGYQMVYGDTYDFPLADDVVAHELTHGVTQYESNLFYYYQSGAINESFSDVWGEYYDQTNGEGNDSASVKWLIGEDVFDLGALRSMSNPPAFGDPDKMSSVYYSKDAGDNGGVHTNSGVNNKAVFLIVEGGVFNGKLVSPLGWDKTAAIYYEANTNLLSSGADYSDLYYALQQACSNLIGIKGITSGDCGEVRDALDAVEMNSQPEPDFNPDAPYCDQGAPGPIIFSDDLESGTKNWSFSNGTYVRWRFDSPYGSYAHSGRHFLFADDYPAAITDASARLSPVTIPNDAYLHFAHAFDFFEASSYYFNGGALEYSTDGGSTWADAGYLMDVNGYNGAIAPFNDNPLQGRSAFMGTSHGYISTRLDLAPLAGETVSFRWRMGLGGVGYVWGWWLDDVQIYQCLSKPDTTSPTLTSIVRAGKDPTSASSVSFAVKFSEPVMGVDVDDFSLAVTGNIVGAEITNLTGSGSTWTIAVNTGSGDGTLGLSMPETATVTDLSGNSLKGLPFADGQVYTIHKTTDVEIYVGSSPDPVGRYSLKAGQSARQSFVGVNLGPVKIKSTPEIPIIAAERVIYKTNNVPTSFSEMMGLPDSQLDNTYWLPWYNNVDLDTQIRFGNVSGTQATVRLYIGGHEISGGCLPPSVPYPYVLDPGQSLRVSCPGVNSGPVQIQSNVNIVAAERVVYKVNALHSSFTEMMALPNSLLTTTYWLPWYNNVDLDTQLRFGNVSTDQSATVRLYIGGHEMLTGCLPSNVPYPYVLGPGQSLRVSCPNVNNGPVKIESDHGMPIVAAERVIYKVNNLNTSFTEMMALPNGQLNNTYWLPWYNNLDLDTQIRFGNVGDTPATIRLFIGGVEKTSGCLPSNVPYPYVLAGGASLRVSCPGVNNGPVHLVSDQNIVAAERVIYKAAGNTPTSFSEMMALPDSQLNATYWLPWYNNIDLDTQLRFGVP